MTRRKKTRVEIVRVQRRGASEPTDVELLPAQAQRQPLHQLAEIVAAILQNQKEAIFEPWFRSRQVAYEIKRHQSALERRKWGVYFQKWGCLRCGSKTRIHATHGLCEGCQGTIVNRLKMILRELEARHHGRNPESAERMARQVASLVLSAERLLGNSQEEQ